MNFNDFLNLNENFEDSNLSDLPWKKAKQINIGTLEYLKQYSTRDIFVLNKHDVSNIHNIAKTIKSYGTLLDNRISLGNNNDRHYTSKYTGKTLVYNSYELNGYIYSIVDFRSITEKIFKQQSNR